MLTYEWFLAFAVSSLVLFPGFCQAEDLNEDQIKAAVQTWVRHVTADARPDAFIARMQPYRLKGKTVAYIAHLTDGGFCLCGTDDLVLPVYLYSPIGEYDPKIPGLQFILKEIAGRTSDMRVKVSRKDSTLLQLRDSMEERVNFWQNLIHGYVPQRMDTQEAVAEEPTIMELDFTAKWHQGTPYNDQCPYHPIAGLHTLVGCGLTAAAQVMYYWRWPNTGMGSAGIRYEYRWRYSWASEPLANNPGIDPTTWAGRLQWTGVSGGQLQINGTWDEWLRRIALGISDDPSYQTALNNLYYNHLAANNSYYAVDFGNTTYNWGMMEDIHPATPAGDAEVAKLCYHVGVASEADHGIWASGAVFSHSDPTRRDISEALDYHFRYDGDIYVYPSRNPATMYYMAEEIQWLRPVLLGGSNPDGAGHAYVVYGYNAGTDPNRQFLVNLGWGTDLTGDGQPANRAWYTLDTTPFPLNQDHTIRIAPENVVKFVGAADPGDGTPDDPYQNIEQAISLAANNTELIFKAGSINAYSGESLVIDRPFTLSGNNVVIGE